MRLGLYNRYAALNALLTTQRNAPIGDDLLLPFNVLAVEGAKRNVEVVPLVNGDEPVDATLFLDFPDGREPSAERAWANSKNSRYLLTFEPDTVLYDNWLEAFHDITLRRVLTWSDEHVERNPERHVKINYAFDRKAPRLVSDHLRLAALIASNKTSQHPRELYSSRRETIRWFAQHHPNALGLYGPGWQHDSTGAAVWRGTIPPGKKREVLAHHAFGICYENAPFAGYITEKIFDCFLAGVVPVYLGATNVSRWIPPTCFIDRRDYRTHEELYERLQAMTPQEHALRVQAAHDFLDGPASDPFTVETFAKTILDTVLEGT